MAGYDWITFLTDYGLENKFIGVCRGVIARIAPTVRTIDITHLVPRGDVRHGAAVLAQSMHYLPPAVHLAVVDPGVGTSRRAIVLRAGGQLFVGPDNGLLIGAAEELGEVEDAYEISDPTIWLQPRSSTFHGRDLFAPAAAHLAVGRERASVGPRIPDNTLVRLIEPERRLDGDRVLGEALIVDRFGNVQTSIPADMVTQLGVVVGTKVEVTVGDTAHILPFCETFGNVAVGSLLAHIDSASMLAFAVNQGDAAITLGLPTAGRFELKRI